METWNVMLVDHDRLFSAALGTLISSGPFRIGHYAVNPAEAQSMIEQGADPDLVVLAIHDAGEDLEGLARIRSATGARIAVLSDGTGDRSLALALKAGADAYLNKAMSSESLLRSLRLVMLGEVVYPTHVASLLIASVNDRPVPVSAARAQQASNDLSKREVQILRCLLAGQSNKAIARHLHITESTVKMHFKNVMRKINAQNRTQAAVWAIQNGLAPLMNA